jgi:hypothetical protein
MQPCGLPCPPQDLLELLGVCQKRWLLLLPVLAAPEVARQAPQLVADYTAAAATMAGLLQELGAAGPQQLFSCLVQDATARLAKLQACYAGLDSVRALCNLPALLVAVTLASEAWQAVILVQCNAAQLSKGCVTSCCGDCNVLVP